MNNLPFTPGVRSTGARPKRTRQVRRHLAMLAVAIGAAGLLACEEQELSRGIVIGKIDFDDPTWPLPQIPETATVGVPLEIAVWTGGSGCYEYVHTAGGVDGRSAVVRPMDMLLLAVARPIPSSSNTGQRGSSRSRGPRRSRSGTSTARRFGARITVTAGRRPRCTRWRWRPRGRAAVVLTPTTPPPAPQTAPPQTPSYDHRHTAVPPSETPSPPRAGTSSARQKSRARNDAAALTSTP